MERMISPDQRLCPRQCPGNVHLLAENLLGQEGVDQGQHPHHADEGLVHHGGAGDDSLLSDVGHPGDDGWGEDDINPGSTKYLLTPL